MMFNNPTPFPEKPSVRFVRCSMLLPLILPLSAFALGIGTPTTEPHLGEPLRLEIPLSLSAKEALPPRDCIKLSYHPNDPDGENFFKNGRASIASNNGAPLLIVQSSQGITSPFVGFRIKVGCDTHISRDFMLMTNPNKIVKQPPLAPPSKPASTSTAPVTSTKPGNSKISDPAGVLVISRNTTLNKMAHWRYPSSLAQRDKFRQMIAQVNPELFTHAGDRVGSVPVPEGTRLNIPEGLPTWESAPPASLPTQANSNTPAPVEATSKSPSVPVTHTPAPTTAQSNSRLIIGSGRVPTLTIQEFRQTLDRLEQLMNDKTRTESALSDTLTSLINSFGEVKKYLTLVDERLTKAEAEQQHLRAEIQRLRDERQNAFNLIELLLAIVGGGAIGAGLVLFFRHRIYSSTPSPSSSLSDHDTAAQHTHSSASYTATQSSRSIPPVSSIEKSEPRVSNISTPHINTPITTPQETKAVQAIKQPISTDALSVTSPAFSTPSVELSSSPSSTSATPVVPLDTALQIPITQSDASLAAPPEAPSHPAIDPAIELADLMMSLGLAQEAARALLEHIHQNLHQDPAHWFKVLEIYRKTNQRASFEKIAHDLNKALNVAVSTWDVSADKTLPNSLEDYPHLMTQLQSLWPKPECEVFLIHLLEDNRDGQRTGFPQTVIEEIMLLRSLLKLTPAMDFPPI